MARPVSSSLRSKANFLWNGLRATLTAINLLLALGMLGVYAIPWLDPRWFAPLALVGFLYYPLLIGLIACAVLWILRKNHRFWISLAVLALGFRVHPVWWHGSLSEDGALYTQALIQGEIHSNLPNSTKQWKVISYNVGFFRYPDALEESSKPLSSSRDFLIKLLNVVQPDLVGLQDFISWEPNRPDVLRSLTLHPGLRGYTMIGQDVKRRSFLLSLDANFSADSNRLRHKGGERVHAESDHLTTWVGGMVMLTRRPVLNFGYQNLGEPGHNGGMMWADILLAEDTLRWLNLHLASNRISPPELGPIRTLDLQNDSSQRTIKGILRKIVSSARLRAEQAHKIKKFMDGSPFPLLVTGDFNDLPYSYTVNRIQDKLDDSFVRKGKGMGNTYARGFPSFRIDHIMIDPRFPIQSHEVVQLRYSDHYPLVAVLGR